MSFREWLRALAAIAVGCVLAVAVWAGPANAASLSRLGSAIGRVGTTAASGPLLPAASAQFRTVDYPGAPATGINCVNNSGVLLGSWANSPSDYFGLAFIEQPGGQPISFNYPGTTGAMASSCVNDLGVAVGVYLDSSNVIHGWVRSTDGKLTQLDDFAGVDRTYVVGINDNGVIAGTYFDASDNTHPFIYQRGTFTTINIPEPATSEPGITAINNSGAIVGTYNDPSGFAHGYLYKNGRFTTIDAPGAGTAPNQGTIPQGISSSDVIDGDIANDSGTFGWVLSGGHFSSLNDPDAAPGQSVVYNLSSNARYACGEFVTPTGADHGFVATLFG